MDNYIPHMWIGFTILLAILHFLAIKFKWFRRIGIIDLFYQGSLLEKIIDIVMFALIYCPTQGGVKPPPLGGGFSVSFVVCGHEQLS